MMRYHRRLDRTLVEAGEWSRVRLWSLLVGGLVVALALMSGLAWSVRVMMVGDIAEEGDANGGPAGGASTTISPWPDDDGLSGALPGDLSDAPTGTITLPSATSIGPAGVPTGFPRTPAGALAQLIALDRAALESLSIPRAQDGIRSWAVPDGPEATSWTVIAGIARLLSAAGQPASGTTQIGLRAEAAMGQFSGIDKQPEDTIIACVDLVLTLTLGTGTSKQVAAADCQRLTWLGNRWVIAAGPEPASSPSVWPGTQAAVDAGYQWLEVGP